MKYALYLGKRYGYLLLNSILDKGLSIKFIFVEKEFEHETEKYYDSIVALCESNHIPFTGDCSLSKQKRIFQDISVDLILVYGYRKIISEEIYEKAEHGAVAMHYALLPKYRGFAPVNWAIINGERETGVSLFFLSKEMDDGDIIQQQAIPINDIDDINSVIKKCDSVALDIFEDQIDHFECGILQRTPQDRSKATYTCSITPEDSRIIWDNTTASICNLIRATTHPYPCAYTFLDGAKVKVLTAAPFDAGNYVGRIPGRIIRVLTGTGLIVLTGDGAILIKSVMDENGVIQTADSVCRSVRVKFK